VAIDPGVEPDLQPRARLCLNTKRFSTSAVQNHGCVRWDLLLMYISSAFTTNVDALHPSMRRIRQLKAVSHCFTGRSRGWSFCWLTFRHLEWMLSWTDLFVDMNWHLSRYVIRWRNLRTIYFAHLCHEVLTCVTNESALCIGRHFHYFWWCYLIFYHLNTNMWCLYIHDLVRNYNILWWQSISWENPIVLFYATWLCAKISDNY